MIGEKFVSPYTLHAYSVYTGTPKYSGAFDYLPTYRVEEKNGEISLVDKCEFEKSRLPTFTKPRMTNFTEVALVGDGAASSSCAFHLRRLGFEGKINLINESDEGFEFTSNKVGISPSKKVEFNNEFWEALNVTKIKDRGTHFHPKLGGIVTAGGKRIEYNLLFWNPGYDIKMPALLGLTSPDVYQKNILKQDGVNTIKGFGNGETIGIQVKENSKELAHLIKLIESNASKNKFIIFLSEGDKKEIPTVYDHLYNRLSSLAEIVKGGVSYLGLDGPNLTYVENKEGTKKEIKKMIFSETYPDIYFMMDKLRVEPSGHLYTSVASQTLLKSVFVGGSASTCYYSYFGKSAPVGAISTKVAQGRAAAFGILGTPIAINEVPIDKVVIDGQTYMRIGLPAESTKIQETGSLSNGTYRAIASDKGLFTGLFLPQHQISEREAVLLEAMRYNLDINTAQLFGDKREQGSEVKRLKSTLIEKYKTERQELLTHNFDDDDNIVDFEMR